MPTNEFRLAPTADKFVKLDLYGRAFAILSILDKKYHQKVHNGCAGIDDQLPCIGKSE
jgi:hypothetical protein